MNTDKPLLQEINERRSIRAFTKQEIEPAKLDLLWAAAQWAPSSSNKQDWHFYALTGAAIQKMQPVLSRGNQWALEAPLLLGVTHNYSAEEEQKPAAYGMYDVALSVMSLILEAEHQGLKAHQIAGFDKELFTEVLNIPATQKPAVMVPVGYEGDTTQLDERTQEKEKKPRIRKELSEIITLINS